MAITLDGTLGITTPSETNTGTLAVTGVTTLTGGLNAALPVLSGGTGVTTSTGTGAVVLGTSPTLTTPTFDSASLPTISGTAPLYMCRAWVNFNGTTVTPSTIRGSGNVSSVTKNATGTYTVNFTTAMVDVNYSVVTACSTNNVYNNDGVGFVLSIAMNTSTPIQYSTAGVRVSAGLSNGLPSEGGSNYSQVAVFR